MKVGVPKEVKNHEYRVAITPVGVHELVRSTATRSTSREAGTGSSIPDEEYVAAGATMLRRRRRRLGHRRHGAQGQGAGRGGVRTGCATGQMLFTYLHLAADQALTEELLDARGHRHRLRDGAAARSARCRCCTR